MSALGPDELRVFDCDNHVLVVEKPACVPTVPDDSGDASLLDAARAWVEREYAKPGRAYLGVVHRLDRPVSGLVVFARTSKAAARLTEAFASREVEKVYRAVAEGWPEPSEGIIEQWLVKDRERNRVRVVAPDADAAGGVEGARPARTRWRTLAREGGGGARRALLELEAHTGRPHQLRVALAWLRCPLRGDLKYGASEALPDRSIALHAARLAFEHPTRRERLVYESPPPDATWWRVGSGGGPG